MALSKKSITLFVILGVAALIFLILAFIVFFMKEPVCGYGCAKAPTFMNGPDCISVKEKYSDDKIIKPTPIPYLTGFSSSLGSGPAFCLPVWYAYRYVRNSDGGYGPLSAWTGSNFSSNPNTPMAIYAGATALPCAPYGTADLEQTVDIEGSARPHELGVTYRPPQENVSNCGAWGIALGPNACQSNQPKIGLIQDLDFDINFYQEDGYTLNVHRQTGYIDGSGKPAGFEPGLEGDIVGSFIVGKLTMGQTGTFVDAVFNPNNGVNSSCC